MPRGTTTRIRQIQLVSKLLVIASQIAHQRKEIGMIPDRSQMRIILECAMIRQPDFRGALQLGNRFFRFAAKRINFGHGMHHVMEVQHAAL